MATIKRIYEELKATFGDEAFDDVALDNTQRSATLIAPDASYLSLDGPGPQSSEGIYMLTHTSPDAPTSLYKHRLVHRSSSREQYVEQYTEDASWYELGFDDSPLKLDRKCYYYDLPEDKVEASTQVESLVERSILISREASRILMHKLRHTHDISIYTAECARVLEDSSQHLTVITADVLKGWQEAEV
jgi:hypothetical protein